MSNDVKLLLQCHHTTYVNLNNEVLLDGPHAYCPKCQSYKRIHEIVREWSIKCTDCRYSRKFGMAELAAHLAAKKHTNKSRHTVLVMKNKVIARVSKTPEQQPLF